MRNQLYIYSLLVIILTGCISDFEAEGVKSTAGMLVVEGKISFPTGTVIKLSRTKDLGDPNLYRKISGAEISVISEDGRVIANLTEGEPGKYEVLTELDLSPDIKYAVDIHLKGNHYQSRFEQPLLTPDIEEVTWKLNDAGDKMDIRVTTHDPAGKINYFLWEYDEDWEIRAQYFANAGWNPYTYTVDTYSLYGFNTYYCWNKDHSKEIIVGDNKKLEGGILKDKKLYTIEAGDRRMSYLYSTLVKQYALSYDAYIYYNNLHSNISESGSLFAPQPTEMEGNIVCLSNPEEHVIGYVCTSALKMERIYINVNDVPTMKEKVRFCDQEPGEDVPGDPAGAYRVGWGILDAAGNTYSYRILYCVDCRLKGTKEKPDFWPNDHQ